MHGQQAKQKLRDDRKGSAHSRGYGKQWQEFRLWHRNECFLLRVPRAGLCGSRLPGTPTTTDSECQQHGRAVPARVLDHIVPTLGPNDKNHLNPQALQWLCDHCHNVKRQRERAA